MVETEPDSVAVLSKQTSSSGVKSSSFSLLQAVIVMTARIKQKRCISSMIVGVCCQNSFFLKGIAFPFFFPRDAGQVLHLPRKSRLQAMTMAIGGCCSRYFPAQ